MDHLWHYGCYQVEAELWALDLPGAPVLNSIGRRSVMELQPAMV